MNDKLMKEVQRLEIKRGIEFLTKDTILISYPKCGRTWVRMMLAKLLIEMDYSNEEYEMLPALHKQPLLIKDQFSSDIRVIFLYRNIGDVVMSFFWESVTSDRNGIEAFKSPHYFIRDERFGIPNIANFYNIWFNNIHKFKDHLFITYEDLHNDTFSTMMEVVKFLCAERECIAWHFEGQPEFPDQPFINFTVEGLKNAIEYSKFENMKRIEKENNDENLLKNYKGNFGNKEIRSDRQPDEPWAPGERRHWTLKEYLKDKEVKDGGRCRRGTVNGYLDDLKEEVDLHFIRAVEERINWPEKK